ncbi:MAG: SURF1 family protein [Spongiibacteraceae bacterium]
MISSLRWNIHKPSTAFALLGLALLLSLGVWQLRRADEKRQVQIAFDAQRSAAPITLSQLPEQPPQYTRLSMRGHYDNARSFLLDNRVMHSRFGYEVLTVFIPVASEKVVLVNRGWVEGDPSRMQRPQIAAVEGEVQISGAVYRDTAKFHFIDNAHETSWPKLIQYLQSDDLQQQIGGPAFPFTVRLDEGMPGAYRIEWQVVAEGFGPERHIAYAVTWFTLAVALIVVWLLSNTNIAQLLTRESHGE